MTTKDFDFETFVAYRRLLDMSAGIIDKAKFYETAKAFVDAYEREDNKQKLQLQENLPERELPEVGGFYRGVFGDRYIILGVHDSFPDGEPVKKPFILFARMVGNNLNEAYTLPLEDFFNPAFVKE